MQTMKAVVKYAADAGATELRDVPIPEIGPDEVLVEVAFIGVCGTDPHMHHNRISFKMNVPLILGHEFSGTIVKTGDSTEGFEIGQRVTAETHADYCGKCALCRTNNYHICPQRKGYGFHVDGAFAKYVRVPTRIIHKLPRQVPLRQACLTEPLCVAYKAVIDNSTVRPGDTVVVIGPGPIGLLSVRMAKLAGASRIVSIGTGGDEKRLQMAKQFGATVTINSSNQKPLPQILALGDGYGADLIIDTAGPAETLALSMQAVRPGGQITKIGWGPKPVNLSLDPLISKSITLKGHFSHTWDVWEKCLTLMAGGQVNLETLITHELSIEEWEKAFELVESKQAVKVVLKPID